MWVKNLLKLSKYKQLSIIITVLMLGVASPAQAEKLNAGFVLNNMGAKEKVGYISGVIEGLAYSRFLRDRPNEDGMICINRWINKDGTKRWKKMEALFARHADKSVSVLLYVLIKGECGE